MKKAIVTGANGFIGSHLVDELLSHDIEVIAVVRNEKSNIQSLPENKKLKIIYCELKEIENLTEKISDKDIDIFYHQTYCFVHAGIKKPGKCSEKAKQKQTVFKQSMNKYYVYAKSNSGYGSL